MKKGLWMLVTGVVLMTLPAHAQLFRALPKEAYEAKQRDSMSYVVGMQLGYLFEEAVQEMLMDYLAGELDMLNSDQKFRLPDVMVGLDEVLYKGDKAAMTKEQTVKWLTARAQAAAERAEALAAEAKAATDAWLAEIEAQPGVQKSESGLLYRIDVPGDTTRVRHYYDEVNYTYTIWNMRGEECVPNEGGPVYERYAGQHVEGCVEGLTLIGQGGKITIWLPAELAFGSYGRPDGGVGPGEGVKYEIELQSITPYVEEESDDERSKSEQKILKKIKQTEAKLRKLYDQMPDYYY